MHGSYYPVSRSPFLCVQSSRRPNASVGCHVPESVKSQDHFLRQLNPVSAWTQVQCPGTQVTRFWIHGKLFRENPSIGHTISFPGFFLLDYSAPAGGGNFCFGV